MYWSEQTWKDLQANPPQVVLLPIGSVEAHGPHLPLATDSIISEEMARRAALELNNRNVRTLVLPPIHYVVTEFSKDFPGTVSISKKSFQSLLTDIAESLAAQKVSTLCIVNSHLEPDHIRAIHEFATQFQKM